MTDGIVYVLTNPAMPNMVKIGITTREEVEVRMAELFSTGVPLPFECPFAGKVSDIRKIERAFHKAFGPYRVNPKREFFEIDPEQAIGLLEIICDENVTPEVSDELNKVDETSKDAGRNYTRKRRPRFNFKDMGIPEGATLDSNFNEETCQVVNERDVIYRGEQMSLTRATRLKLDNSYNVAPGTYCVYDGAVLRDIYNETYDFE